MNTDRQIEHKGEMRVIKKQIFTADNQDKQKVEDTVCKCKN